MKIESTRVVYVKRVVAVLFLTLTFALGYGQTTYTWIGGNGGNFATTTNWSPARPVAATSTDILVFNNTGTISVVGFTSQTIGQLQLLGNSDVIIQANATTQILSINGPALNNNLIVESGAILRLASTNTFTIRPLTTTNQRWDISGKVVVNANNTFNTSNATGNIATVSSTGSIDNNGGILTTSVPTLTFAGGSNYNHLATTFATYTIPAATWDAASNCNISTVTTATGLLGFNGQSFGHFTYNCPGQTAATFSLANSGTTTIKGNFNVINTGTGALVLGALSQTLNINGDLNISGGTFNLNSAATITTLNLAGNYNQTGGTLTKSGATSIAAVNFTGIGRTYIQSGGTVINTLINYAVNGAGASLTLNNNVSIAASRTFTASNGTLYCGTNIISGAGSFLMSSANAALGIGSPAGITAAVATLTGNIQTTGGRTFGTSANYIYTGANGQITGTGLPAAVAGYVMLNMSSPTDQLTFSTPGLTGAVTLRMVNGAVDNVLSFSNIGSTLSYEAPYAQTTTNNEFPGGTTTPGKLNIDNPNGVTMHASRWMRGTNDALKLVNGILYIPLNDTLTTSNTVATITGGSATSYVNGAISRNTGTATGLNFPIGKGAYNPVTISPTVQTGSLFITAEVFDADAGGTGSLGIASLNTNRYWKITKTGTGTLTSINTPSVTEYGLNAGNHICYSATVNGVYTMAPSTITGNAIAPNTSIPIPTGATNGDVNLVIGTGGTLSGIVPVGNSSGIQKLYQIAQLLNTSTLIGDVVFELQADYDGTTGEVFPINFYQYDTSGGSWTATVRPAAGATGLVTSGNPGSGVAFVAYNGVDNLSFDGRPGGTGNNVEWILRNTQPAGTATFTPTIQLLNDAGYNTLQYLQVEGQSLASNGTIAIGGTTGTKGNDYNTIQYCNIRDRSDIAGTPATGVYALGATTAGRENDHNVISYNNIYNQWANTGNIHGIYIDGYNSDYRVSNNSIYNSNRTPTGTLTYHGIRVGNTSAIYNCSVDSNFIGGTGKYAGGMQWIQNGSVNATLVGILVAGNTGTTHNIRYNKISNISWRSSYNATAAAPGTFCGIYTQNSSQNIENNVVGSGTGNDSIIVIATGSGSVTYGVAHTSSSGSLNIANNTIGSITAAASGSTISHGVSGIHVEASSGSYRNVTDNLVGSHVTPNSIQATSVSTGTAAQPVSGITIGSGSNGFLITGNTVANLRNAYSAVTAAGVTRGINILFGVGTVSDNTVHHISGNSTQTGVGTSAAVVGIAYSPSSTGNTFTGNIVHSINSTAPTAAVNVAGVVFNGSTTTNVVNVVERNLIHSLTLASSNGTATVTGLHIVAGVATFRNNMIRLGIDESGNSVAPTCSIIGINKATTSVNRIYYNSVYVGGSSVSAGTNTYAFRRTATGTIADTLRNNIFTNLRTGTGSANHIAIGFVASTGIIAANCNYNLFEVASTGGGRVGQVVSTPYATLSDWRTGTTFDANSYFGAAGFINPAGDAANVDLHINPAIPTQVEANATPVGSIVNDYDGDMRISPDIGADEGNFTPIDLTAPVISYTPFAGVCNDVTMHTVIVNISDASGVNTTPGLAPRIYYKKANDAINAYNGNTSGTSGWKYVETASTSSPFTFNIDLTLISGGISAGDAIQYVVVAQDMATPNPNNIGINSGTATFSGVPVSVTLASNGFPISGTPNQFVILPCSGTVTVGTGGNYGVFTTANGIFNAINQATLSGNLTVNVVSDIVNLEDGAVGLNQWAESGLGGYSVIIQSSANVLRTISGSSGVNAGLFRMNGADRVTFDGGTGANKFLVFRNTAVAPSASVFNFTNDATNITVNNCTIEGGAVSATGGVVVVGPAGAGSGNDNITITSCDIKDAASLPTNGIYSAGTTTAGKENSNVTISNCNIYNFFTPTAASSGILVATGSNTWSITNNRFYQTAVRTTTATGIIHSVIRINNTSGGGFNVSDNYIGGVDALGNGVMNYTSTQNAQMGVIYLSVASTPVSTVQNNTITNMLYTSISAATSVVGLYSGIYISAGNATISGNTIGSATGNGAITVTLNNTGTAALVAAIKSESTASININGNIIGGITCTGVGSNSGIGLYGIHFTVGTATVNGNLIGSATTANSMQVNGTATSNANTVTGIYSTASSLYTPAITNNQVRNLTNSNTGTSTTTIGITVSNGGMYTVNGNTIYNLTNPGTTIGSGT